MVAIGTDGIHRTLPTETSRALPEGEPDWSGWESWMEGHKTLIRDEMVDCVGRSLGDLAAEFDATIAAQAKRIRELELALAELRGAIDILRGRGAPGSLRVKGTFDPSVQYLALDVVALNGGSFVALKDAPGPCPGPDWQLLASCGKRGPKGDRGPIGHTGPAAPIWKSVSFDAKRWCLTTRLSDGSLGPEISLYLLFSAVKCDAANYAIKLVLLDGSELSFDLKPLFARFFHEVTGR